MINLLMYLGYALLIWCTHFVVPGEHVFEMGVALLIVAALAEITGARGGLLATEAFWYGYLKIQRDTPRAGWEGTTFAITPPSIITVPLRWWHTSTTRRWLGGQESTVSVLHTDDGYTIEWPTKYIDRSHIFWCVFSFGVRKSLNYINKRARGKAWKISPVSSVTVGSKYAPPRYTVVVRTGAKTTINVTAPEMGMNQWETANAAY